MAVYISSKGERCEIAPAQPPFFSGLELETLVEGMPAFLKLVDGSTLVYNDVSYEIGVEKNEVATTLALSVLPKETWLAGPVVHLPTRAADKTPQTWYLYLLLFEVRDEWGKYLYDNMFLPYVRDEAELQAVIAEIATTQAKGQKFLRAERRTHGMTIMHEHMPATITVEEGNENGTQE